MRWFDKRYVTTRHCINCKKKVSFRTKMYSMGRCPHCGYKGMDACTIMDTIERYEEVPWWNFWS